MHFQRTALSTALALAMGCASSLSFAQKIEEIYVTARKTEEGLQTTPVAVSAMNESMLAEAQVTEVADLKRMAPSLSIMTGGTGSSSLIYLSVRGNAQVSPSGGTDPAVATYVDGVYLARPTGGNVDMFDVGLAEVLRGPQGTLFGRNTTGGALNIRTNDPTGNFEGYVKGEVGNYGHQKVEGVVNVPLMGDELAARFAVRYNQRDGYGDYRGYSDPAGYNWSGFNSDAADVDKNTYVRGKVKWDPADSDLTVTLGVDWSEFADSGQRSQVMAINPAASNGLVGGIFAANGFNPDNFVRQQKYGDTYWGMDNSSTNPMDTLSSLERPGSTNDNKGIFLDIGYDISDDVSFKSVTAYRESNSSGQVDLDGTPVSLLTFASRWDQDQWSQEFQLAGNVNGDLEWITGLYYFSEESGDYSINRFGGPDLQSALPLLPGALPATTPFCSGGGLLAATCIGSNDSVHDNTSYGGFAQVNYSFTEKLRATLGYRYTYDQRVSEIYSESVIDGQLLPETCKIPADLRNDGVTCHRTQDARFHYPAWTFGLDYQALDNLFLYAKTSGASMAGGWNFRAFSNQGSFDPENVRDVEVGFKSDLFDGNVRLNGAFFMAKASDQQRLINLAEGVTPVQFIRNAGQSESKGAELELTWLPWDGMVINANFAWLDMEYEKYESVELITSGANAGQFITLDRSDEHAPHAPEFTYSLGATQTFQTPLGALDLHLDYSWVDETWFQDSTVNPYEGAAVQAIQREEKRWNSVPDYGVVNAQAVLRTDDGHWEGALWVRNLTDEEYYTNVANFWNAFGSAARYVGDPRTFGASVRYNW